MVVLFLLVSLVKPPKEHAFEESERLVDIPNVRGNPAQLSGRLNEVGGALYKGPGSLVNISQPGVYYCTAIRSWREPIRNIKSGSPVSAHVTPMSKWTIDLGVSMVLHLLKSPGKNINMSSSSDRFS